MQDGFQNLTAEEQHDRVEGLGQMLKKNNLPEETAQTIAPLMGNLIGQMSGDEAVRATDTASNAIRSIKSPEIKQMALDALQDGITKVDHTTNKLNRMPGMQGKENVATKPLLESTADLWTEKFSNWLESDSWSII